jgi:hypothetical protein
MLMNLEDENLQISISDKNFSETILEGFNYGYTNEGCLIDLFDVTSNIITDAKFDLFKKLIGENVPESLQTDEYMDFIFKVFKMKRISL